MFEGITLREFNNFFRNENDCRKYLFDLKFKKGYRCRQCRHGEFTKGRTSFHARCCRCRYDESFTAHTMFHKLQIPLLKAFAMAFHIVAFKKGVSTIELGKVYGVNQKTAWTFKRKVQDAMAAMPSRGDSLAVIETKCKLDSIVLSHRTQYLNGLQRVHLKIQKNASTSKLDEYIKCKGSLIGANEIDKCNLLAGKYVDEGKDILIWNFKVWLTGVHHHCSEKYLQGYLDEYFFRHNFRSRQTTIWHSLIRLMTRTNPEYLTVKAAGRDNRVAVL